MVDELFIHNGGWKDLEHRLWLDRFLPRRSLEENTVPTSDDIASKESFNDPLSVLNEIGSCFAELAEHTTWIKSGRNLTIPPRVQHEDNGFLSANDQGSAQGMQQRYQCPHPYHPDASSLTQSSVDETSCQIGQPKTEEQLLTELEAFCEDSDAAESKWTFDYHSILHSMHAIKDPLRWYWRALESPGKPQEGQHTTLNAPYCMFNHGHSEAWPSSHNSRSQFSGRRGKKSTSSVHTRMGRNEIQGFLKSLKHNIRSNLEHMRNFFDLVSSTMSLLDDAKIPLDMIGDELLEWLKKIELLSNQLFERFKRFYSQFLIYALIFFCLFNEFPNSIRHLCTTMPWTIWPALVVLWGVCWMFYSESGSNKAPEGESLISADQQRQLLNCQDGDLENDTGINLPITTSPNNTAIPISLWDWTAIPDWGAGYETTQTEAAIFAMTPGRSEIVCINQSLSDEFSNAVPVSASEPRHESQMNVNLTSQATGASSSTNRVSRRTQRGPFKCPDCGKTFARSDSLKRHRNEMHAEVVEEFLCPNLGCKKSEKGHGFKRRDKLEKHENSSCKGRVPSTSSNQSTASTPPIAVSTPDDTTIAPLIHQESIPAGRIDNGSRSNGGTLENQESRYDVETTKALSNKTGGSFEEREGLRG